MNRDDYLLEMQSISKEYPGVRALDSVSIGFSRGEVHALVGENGAGKSTLMKTISGSIAPTSGTILYEGKKYTQMNPKDAINMGISTIYQEFSLVSRLSVAENMFMGTTADNRMLFSKKKIYKKARELICGMDLSLDETQLIEKLTPAHQQMVEILRAISRNARVIIMDEPTAALSNAETHILFRVINQLKSEGVTIIYISHRMEEIFEIADRVTVLRDGQYVKTCDIDKTDEKEIVRLMVGRDVGTVNRADEAEKGSVTIEVKGLTRPGFFENVSFKAYAGEILGFGGLVGAGRTEVMRCIFGADDYAQGEILLLGKPLKCSSPKEAIRSKIALIPEDRKQQGLILGMSVEDNICASIYHRISKCFVYSEKKKNASVEKYTDSLRIKTPDKRQLVKNLSGGNQQKVVLAKMLATDSDIIIFDEPTRGIDVGAKYEIYEIMHALAKQGKTIIMVSSDMMELIGVSDRIVVMREGSVMGELNTGEFEEEKIMALASGIMC